MNKQQTQYVPAGGSATVNGVLYQTLWSLLRASKARLARAPVIDKGQPVDMLLVLEPPGGGGDIVFKEGLKTVVEQLKARPNLGTWSLREVVESVLPDLYAATPREVENVEFRFVTEGRIGDWRDVYRFFRSLRNRECPDDPLADLEDSIQLKFRRSSRKAKKAEDEFWNDENYTERTLFEKITSQLRKRKTVSKAESTAATQRRLRALLGNFEFVGGETQASVQSRIDTHLLAVVGRNDDVERMRDALAMELARLATQGGVTIDCNTFFESQGLSAIPLTDLGLLTTAVRSVTTRKLSRLRYDPTEDARVSFSKQILSGWRNSTPVLLVTGESGCGKSWTSYSLCNHEQDTSRFSICVQAADSCEATLRKAADEIWQEAARHDESIPLFQIGRRLAVVNKNLGQPWLTLCVDRVVDLRLASDLVAEDWEEWGIRVVLGVDKDIAKQVDRDTDGRCSVVEVGDFNNEEIETYLRKVLGESWLSLPHFVRSPLKKPLLASVYSSIVKSSPERDWTPQTEYQIFDAFWDRIYEPLDKACLCSLAQDCIENEHTSWTFEAFKNAGFNETNLRRLQTNGWLRMADSGLLPKYEFTHLRLLNWACAVSLIEEYCKDGSEEKIEQYLHDFLWESQSRFLGFVTMDFLWLALKAEPLKGQVPKIIRRLERENYNYQESLFKELLPTLGDTVVETLVALLLEHIDDPVLSNLLTTSVCRAGGENAAVIGRELLDSDNKTVQMRGAAILAQSPDEAAMDALWKLHTDSQKNNREYLRPFEEKQEHLLYDRTFEPLRRCLQQAASWLEEQIIAADPEHEPLSDLAYLLGNLPYEEGRPIWLRQKSLLFRKMPVDKRRSLAMCIDRFADKDEINWLTESVDIQDDWLGPAALRALARLQPQVALEQLDNLDSQSFRMANGWFSDQLFTSCREETLEKLASMMSEPERLWSVAKIFHARFHFVNVKILDLMLNQFTSDLRELLSDSEACPNNKFFQQFQLLIQANTESQLKHLETYRDSDLENLLVEYVVRIGPPKGNYSDSQTRSDAIQLLQRIQGDGFPNAVNSLLSAETDVGRFEGLKYALRQPNAQTLSLLKKVSEIEECSEQRHYHEQCQAALALAESGSWEPVLELVRRIGLRSELKITYLPKQDYRPDPALLEGFRASIENSKGHATPGQILVLGFGASKCADTLTSFIANKRPVGELAHACTIALDLLDDSKTENVEFLSSQLIVEEHRHAAINALISNGSTAAWDVLHEHNQAIYSEAISINLIHRSTHSEDAVRKSAIASMQDAMLQSARFDTNVLYLVRNLDDDDARDLLSPRDLQSFIRQKAFEAEGRSWSTGSKAAAISCLDVFDNASAIEAAAAALRNPKSHDRRYYASILTSIGDDSTHQVLLDIMESEEDKEVRAAIGLAVAEKANDDFLCELFNDQNESKRTLACSLARWRKPTESIKSELQKALADPIDSVAREAASSLVELRRQEETIKLCSKLTSASTVSQRWLLLVCALELADPINEHHRWPLYGPDVWEYLTPNQVRYAYDRLERRRKEQWK